jgi:hypothetical protein
MDRVRVDALRRVVYLALIAGVAGSGAGAETPAGPAPVIWIALNGRPQLKRTAPGATLAGKLSRSLYWRDVEVFPQGSPVRLVVDRVEPRKKVGAVDDRPFFLHLFAPRHEWVAQFRSVRVETPGGGETPLRATFIALAQRAELAAKPAPSAAPAANANAGAPAARSKPPKADPPWVLALQVEPEGTTFAALAAERPAAPSVPAPACPEPCRVAESTRLPVLLLGGLSASKGRQGQTFTAVLLEPVRVGQAIAIPQGSILQGVLAKRVPPRRLYRPGSLNLLFTRLTLPNGAATAIAASPVAAEVDKGTHMTMDAEGRIHAQNPGKARFLLDFGVSGGFSKVSDDTTQLIIEAISSTATDASTAGVARFAAMGASAIYLLTRHGRDVILPAYTEMDVSLSRAVSLGSNPPTTK